MTTRTLGSADEQGELSGLPGQARSAPGHRRGRELRALTPEECLGLLEPGGVGRVGLMSAEGIVMLPVNYAIAANTIVFRTAPDTLLAAHANGPASFQADRLDEASRAGWSVLLQGRAHFVTSEREVRGLERETRLQPWADGARDVWMRLIPVRISGRRIG